MRAKRRRFYVGEDYEMLEFLTEIGKERFISMIKIELDTIVYYWEEDENS
jgi:hypothetical protein